MFNENSYEKLITDSNQILTGEEKYNFYPLIQGHGKNKIK